MSANFAEFSWSEKKRTETINKHGIDFATAIEIFDGEGLHAQSKHSDEQRWIAVGLLHGIEIAVIYTMRGDTCRIITARRARHNERENYHARYPGGGP